ncbi:hypothetical protein T484DRAFT_1922585 [Baffinella frigidus]|nr:hypothetical protein T484DRAFT_1922585 [Cryptophyta sp. CCMP2293]
MSMPRRHDAGVAAPPRGNLPSASQATPTRGRGRAKGSAVRMACAVLLASCAVRCDDLPLSGTSRLGSTTASALLSRARYPPQHIHTERAAVSAQSPHLPRGRLRGGGGDGQGGGASPVAGGSGGALSRTRSVSQVPVRLLRDVIRRVQSQDWMNVLGIAEGTASIATGRASPSLPAPPTSHLARELAPGTGEAAGAAGEGGLMLPPGLASEEQASADRLFAGALKHDPESVEVLRLYARYVHLSRCHRPPTSARLVEGIGGAGGLVEVGDTSRDEAAFAEKLFERALARDPTNPETLCDYGLFLFLVREDPNGAERRFKESLGLESDADFDEVQELLRPPATKGKSVHS